MKPPKAPASLRKICVNPNSTNHNSPLIGTGIVCTSVIALMAAAGTAMAGQTDSSDNTYKDKSRDRMEETIVEGHKSDDHNPRADREAPYKIDRSASGKFTQPLLDTAKSISIVPKEVIKDSGATSFAEVMRTQPGITLGTGEGGNAFGDRIFIRGYDARNDVYVDGMRDPGVVSRETFAVEQVEIIKGPSSSFAGRGSTGGAVDLVSKEARNDDFHKVEATVGSADTKSISADINQVLSENLAARINVLYHDAETPGRHQVFQERKGLAAAINYQLTDRAALGLDYYRLETDGLPEYGVPFDPQTQQPAAFIDRHNFYGLVERDFRETSADVTTLKFNYQLSDSVSLHSQLRSGETVNRYVVSAPERPDYSDADPANWTVLANPKSRNATNDAKTFQTDLTFNFDTGGITHTLVSGIEISEESVANTRYQYLDSESDEPLDRSELSIVQNLLNPNPFQPVDLVLADGDTTTTSVDGRAVYVLDTVHLNEQWQILGGLRYDDYSLEQIGFDRSGNPTNLANDSNFVNWHFGTTYKPTDNGSIYFAISSSSNPSGEQLDASGNSYGGISSGSEALDPERNKSYEIGTKWELFNRHLLFTAALFRTDKENARVSDPNGGGGSLVLDGEQRVQGAEFTAGGNITERLSLHSGLTLLDTEILNSTDAGQIGEELANIADTSFNMLASYQLTTAFRFGAQAYYNSEIHGGTVTRTDAYVPGYWRFDLFAHYDLGENFELTFNVLNATDKVYYDAIYRSSTPFAYIAPGRAAKVSLEYTF